MKRRAGFTLTELLIVIGIILVLGTLTLAVFGGRNTDKTRSAARVVQSAFLGAKDRAMHAKAIRGVRFTRDPIGVTSGPWFIVSGSSNGIPCLATGFSYIQPIDHPAYSAGSIQLERIDQNPPGITVAASSEVWLVHGIGVDWPSVSWAFGSPGQIRIPSTTGQWYQFTIDQNGPYSGGNYLRLSTSYSSGTPASMPATVAFPTTSGNTNSCDIRFGNEVLPFHDTISLPAGLVIDLRYCSSNVQVAAGSTLATGSTVPNIDITFSPRGNVAGAAGGSGAIYLVIRDMRDATGIDSRTNQTPRDPSDPKAEGEILIVAVNPQTGLVQTYEADLTDANGDNLADNLFRFAQQGKAAGR